MAVASSVRARYRYTGVRLSPPLSLPLATREDPCLAPTFRSGSESSILCCTHARHGKTPPQLLSEIQSDVKRNLGA